MQFPLVNEAAVFVLAANAGCVGTLRALYGATLSPENVTPKRLRAVESIYDLCRAGIG